MMSTLTIAIDASRTTVARRTGTENYALQLIRAMLELDTPHRFVLYFRDTPPADLFPAARAGRAARDPLAAPVDSYPVCLVAAA